MTCDCCWCLLTASRQTVCSLFLRSDKCSLVRSFYVIWTFAAVNTHSFLSLLFPHPLCPLSFLCRALERIYIHPTLYARVFIKPLSGNSQLSTLCKMKNEKEEPTNVVVATRKIMRAYPLSSCRGGLDFKTAPVPTSISSCFPPCWFLCIHYPTGHYYIL